MAYVRTRLGRLYYEERGNQRRPGDPTIVLLHGLLFDGGMWRGQVEALSALGRVVILDGPGHGRSEPAPRFMLEDHADALFDAFGELGIRQAVIVGLSWGGMVGMRLALQHPAKVAALALLDTSAESETTAKRVEYRSLVALGRRFGLPYVVYRSYLAPLMFGPRTIANNTELVMESFRRTAGFERDGLCRAAIAVLVHRKNILPQLGRIRVPTLVLCGRDDGTTVLARSEAIAKAIPNAKLTVIDGIGHMSALEDPAAVNARLVPFVAQCVEDGGRS
jgi:3-oxoadipate enol-lactonase